MRYPIGVQDFGKIREGNFIYVDKTDLVYELAHESVCFLSRPRRFGKSLLVSTLDAYFSGKKELFEGLKIEKLEKDWDQYPVFRIDFAVGNYSKENELEEILSENLSVWEEKYGLTKEVDSLGYRFKTILEAAAEQTGKGAVVLIDEYDKPLLDVLGEDIEGRNREILKSFFGTFKAADASLRFVLLTGVTKFSQISVFSGFNQPNDISMDSKYDTLCGITEAELEYYFEKSIQEMANKYEYSVSKMKEVLKKHYDGYHFSNAMVDIYNPFSLINAFSKLDIDNYWYRSGTPTYLVKLLEGHHVNMQKLTERAYRPSYFVDYRADAEDPLAMLYQSGYLTIKGYDREYGEYLLDYPNDEVRFSFVTLMANSYFSKLEDNPDGWVINLTKMLRRCDIEGVRDAFTSFLASIPYEANKDERAKDFETHFAYTFYLINRLLTCYNTLIEKQNSKGRADVIIETERDVFIFEFKLDGSAKDALQQIEDKQYAVPYLSDKRKVHKIGVNISSVSRTVEEWMVI